MVRAAEELLTVVEKRRTTDVTKPMYTQRASTNNNLDELVLSKDLLLEAARETDPWAEARCRPRSSLSDNLALSVPDGLSVATNLLPFLISTTIASNVEGSRLFLGH